MTQIDPLPVVAAMDQVEAPAIAIAKVLGMLGSYYRTLHAEGVPDAAAHELVREASAQWWQRMLSGTSPNGPS